MLPAIPAKRYFTIGEVSELCGVKPYVLRYWEQEFTQLKPMKRRGNRRYYQHHEVLLIRRIRELLYDQGFTISGARNRLTDAALGARSDAAEVAGVANGRADDPGDDFDEIDPSETIIETAVAHLRTRPAEDRAEARIETRSDLRPGGSSGLDGQQLRAELMSIRALLTV